MIIYNSDKKILGNTLEIHYWFNDESHSMNALVKNRCEHEILGLISKILEVETTIETEPYAEGGLVQWLKILPKKEQKEIKIAIITSLIAVVLTAPIGKISEKIIEKIFQDTELLQLEKEKLRLEIRELKNRENSNQSIGANISIIKKKSNFYETLDKYPKVKQVSYSITDDTKKLKTPEIWVSKSEFNKYILTSDDLEPLNIEDATIEIISPVLKKGLYKWTGYYNGDVISFHMKSNEFKTLVQTRKIEFKNGSSINCHLVIKRKIDSEGVVKPAGYDVLRVNSYFENEKPIETSEGKSHRRTKELLKSQFKLFTDNK
jgi:hypothetical protein